MSVPMNKPYPTEDETACELVESAIYRSLAGAAERAITEIEMQYNQKVSGVPGGSTPVMNHHGRHGDLNKCIVFLSGGGDPRWTRLRVIPLSRDLEALSFALAPHRAYLDWYRRYESCHDHFAEWKVRAEGAAAYDAYMMELNGEWIVEAAR